MRCLQCSELHAEPSDSVLSDVRGGSIEGREEESMGREEWQVTEDKWVGFTFELLAAGLVLFVWCALHERRTR